MRPGDYAAWNYVAMRESGWNQFATNPSSGAYGIAQALPPTKYPFAGQAAGGSNPLAQEGWMWNYMAGRYGGPKGAAAHEATVGWYDGPGPQFLPRGLSVALNTTGTPERVLSGNEARGIEKRLDRVISLLEAAPGLQAAATSRALNGLSARVPVPRPRGR
jgi:hypothetical protein